MKIEGKSNEQMQSIGCYSIVIGGICDGVYFEAIVELDISKSSQCNIWSFFVNAESAVIGCI